MKPHIAIRLLVIASGAPLAAQVGALRIVVTDWRGTAIDLASVSLGKRQVTADVNGVAVVSGLPAGRVRVVVRAGGFTPSRRTVTVVENIEQRVDVRLDGGYHGSDTIEPHSGRLSVTITDSAGRAVPNAEVVLTDASGDTVKTRSDQRGVTDFPALPAGECQLEINAAGFKSWRAVCFVDEIDVERVEAQIGPIR